jgi:hypothetical protein
MTTLAQNKPRDFETADLNDLPIVTNDIIYEGAAVGMSSGYARPLVAGDSFAGIAQAKADNTGGANGAINVRVLEVGKIEVDVAGVTGVTNVGATVYAADDDTFTLSSTGNSTIGKIIRHVSGTKCVVAFEAVSRRSI